MKKFPPRLTNLWHISEVRNGDRQKNAERPLCGVSRRHENLLSALSVCSKPITTVLFRRLFSCTRTSKNLLLGKLGNETSINIMQDEREPENCLRSQSCVDQGFWLPGISMSAMRVLRVSPKQQAKCEWPIAA